MRKIDDGRKRPGNKKTLSAWVTPEFQTAIDEWLRLNPDKSQSDFVKLAASEKLRNDGIKIAAEVVRFDGRFRKPAPAIAPSVSGKGPKPPVSSVSDKLSKVEKIFRKHYPDKSLKHEE